MRGVINLCYLYCHFCHPTLSIIFFFFAAQGGRGFEVEIVEEIAFGHDIITILVRVEGDVILEEVILDSHDLLPLRGRRHDRRPRRLPAGVAHRLVSADQS